MQKSISEILQKIRHIQFQSIRLAEGFLAGAYRSAFKGRGMEFEEVREYQVGDDVRVIDWNVTARMHKPYVKNFREEREITMTLVVDISSSTRYGSTGQLKSDYMAEIAAVLAFSALKNNDKVALLLFSDKVEKYFPPKSGSRYVLRLIREIMAFKPRSHGTDISNALEYLGRVQHQSGICFILSDFIAPDYTQQMALRAKRDDVVCFMFVDPSEERLMNMNLVTLADLETNNIQDVDTSTIELQQHFNKNNSEYFTETQKKISRLGADFCPIFTDKSYIPQLHKFFMLRQRRRR